MKRPAWTRDPLAPGLALFTGMVMVGFVAITLGWRVAARTLIVSVQVPALVSGGLGGLALIVLGAGFASIHVGRRLVAQERVETEDLLDEAVSLLDALRGPQQ